MPWPLTEALSTHSMTAEATSSTVTTPPDGCCFARIERALDGKWNGGKTPTVHVTKA